MPTMELFRGKGRKTWQLRFTDHKGHRRRVSTRTESRPTALVVARKIELCVDYRIRGDALPADLQQWLAQTHHDIRDKLALWEVIAPSAAQAGRPLFHDPPPVPLPSDWRDPPASLVDLWEEDLMGREITENYASQSAQRVRVLLGTPAGDFAPIRYFPDVTAEGIMARVRELRRVGGPPQHRRKKRTPCSPQTCEHYLAKTREFFGWLVSKGYAPSNPAAGLTAYSAAVIAENKERSRRALTAEEQATLVRGTPGLATRWKMTGDERALMYHLVLRTGLRRKELRTLTCAAFNFFARTVTVLARHAKNRKEDVLPIAPELVEPLKNHLAGKLPAASAFVPLSDCAYCRMLRQDLKELGIAYQDDLDRYADFHALRHTYGTELAKVVMPAVHQRLMRHASISTTMKFYTHLDRADDAAAIEKLPAMPASLPPAAAGKIA